MKNKNVVKDVILAFVGLGLIGLGFVLNKIVPRTDLILMLLPYTLIGAGCGVFGHYTENLIKYYSIKNNEKLSKEIEINKNDERNVLIAEKSKAKAFDLMSYMVASLIIIFAMMKLDTLVLMILASVNLSLQMYALYWRHKFEKEM